MAQAPGFIETLVTSTRIRLARNLSAYPFPQKLDDKLGEEIIYLIGKTLGKLDNFERNDMLELSEEQVTLLQEQHLISPALMQRKGIGAAFISSDKAVSVMVNEEDHLREQYIYKGFDLYKAYERISGIDEGLSSELQFAYDDTIGYLTACPSNLGTGMRASVMMFLPGLAWSKELQRLIPELKAEGLTVRGVFGEGTAAEGYSYQVSNERTLGISERDILEQMMHSTMRLCDLELLARERMKKEKGVLLKDTCLRAYGTLTNCAALSLEEFLTKIADVRTGIVLNILKAPNQNKFDEFLKDMRPAAFCLNNNLEGESERFFDEVRAETVCSVLPKLVQVNRRG
jgi:protein arginine kinase